MIVIYAKFRTACGTRDVALAKGVEGEGLTNRARVMLQTLYRAGTFNEADLLQTYEEKVTVTVDDCFDEKGNLVENSPVLELFDEVGEVSPEFASAVRERLMEKMPYAHTDLARLFYAVEAQRKSKIGALEFFK